MRLAGLIGWIGLLAAVFSAGCKKTKTVYVVQPPQREVVRKTEVVREPAPAPVDEAPAEEPVAVEPAPAPVAPTPVAVAPAPVAPAPVVVAPAPAPAVSVSFFYERLGRYGRWVSVASYGQVWVPVGVAATWRPYSVGHWVFTDEYGWMWVSEEPWGWATYHYGRWAWVEPHGWVWVPGTVWGPAWVVWRNGGGYVGWAPMPPEVVVVEPRPTVDIDINISVNIVERIRPAHWVFVHERHLCEPVHRHVVVVSNNITILKTTRHVTRIRSVHGRIVNRSIEVRDVERVTGRPVRRFHAREIETDKPDREEVRGNEVVIRRPRLQAASADAPARDSKPASAAQDRVRRNDTSTRAPVRPSANGTPSPRISEPVKRPEQTRSTKAGQSMAGNTAQPPRGQVIRSGKPPQAEPVSPVNARPRVDSVVRDRSAQSQTSAPAPKQPQPQMKRDPQTRPVPPPHDSYTGPFAPPTQPKVDAGEQRRPHQRPGAVERPNRPADKPGQVKPNVPADPPVKIRRPGNPYTPLKPDKSKPTDAPSESKQPASVSQPTDSKAPREGTVRRADVRRQRARQAGAEERIEPREDVQRVR